MGLGNPINEVITLFYNIFKVSLSTWFRGIEDHCFHLSAGHFVKQGNFPSLFARPLFSSSSFSRDN